MATTWRLNLEQLAGNPAAVGLLRLCAFLAPEVIPLSLLAADPTLVPDELKEAVGDELVMDEAVAALYRFSLLGRDHDGLRLHRLVGEVVRATLDPDEEPRWAAAAVSMVAARFPADITEPASWPACAQMLPHALTTTDHASHLGVAGEQAAELLNLVGRYLQRRAEFTAALKAHQRGIRIAEATYGPNHTKVASHVNNLGTVLRDLGDLDGAKANYQRALQIDEATRGRDHPEVAVRLNNLGMVLRDLGDVDGAKAHYQRALQIDEATYGPDHPTIASDLNNLGSLLQDLGDLDSAHAHLERALRILEAAYGSDHPNTRIVAANLAWLQDHQ